MSDMVPTRNCFRNITVGVPRLSKGCRYLARHRQRQMATRPYGIEPNEIADRLANLGTKATRDPDTRSTLAGVMSQVRKGLRGLRANTWRAIEDTTSRRYKSWDLPYDTRHHPEELKVLTRPQCNAS